MEIKGRFVLFCDNAFTSSDGKLNIIGEFDQLYASQGKPILNRGFIVGSFRGEPDTKADIEVKFIDNKGENVLPEQRLNIIFGSGGVANIIMELVGLTFNNSGVYKAVFTSGKKILIEGSLKVTESKVNAPKGPTSVN